MKTSDIFNIKRFGRYFVSDVKSCTSNFGISLLVISLMPIVAYLCNGLFNVVFFKEWTGLQMGGRGLVAAASLCILIISMPAKCYGFLTNKRTASAWLMLPASRVEKYISMLLTMLVVFPTVFFIVFFATDWAICALDPSCGIAFVKAVANISDSVKLLPQEAYDIMSQFTSPYVYIDDFFVYILIFLLGAMCFRKNKGAKTILCIMAVSMIIGLASGPLVINNLEAAITASADKLQMIDKICDTILLVALLCAIWFKLKTLKR